MFVASRERQLHARQLAHMLPKVLLCLDSDRQPSVFDSVVAIDAGVDHVLRHSSVEPDGVRDLVYGFAGGCE